MKKDFKVGDHVGWNSEAGHVRGTIKKKITSAIAFKGYTVRASKEEPQYLIKKRHDRPSGHAQGISAQETQKQSMNALRTRTVDCVKKRRKEESSLLVMTIGHSTHTLGEFIGLLQAHEATCVVDVARYFHLDDGDLQRLASKRGAHNRLGFAVQLTTVRYLGRFLDDMTQAPRSVLSTLSSQLDIPDANCLLDYRDQRQRLRHIEEICWEYGYREITSPFAGLRLARWPYAAQCWTGTDRPIVLFEWATSWLLAHKVLLPGASTMERFVTKLRQRVEQRLRLLLGQSISKDGQLKLEALLLALEGNRRSCFDQLWTGPTNISGPSLVRALERLDKISNQGITLPVAWTIPASRIAALARFAIRAKAKRSAGSQNPGAWLRWWRSRGRSKAQPRTMLWIFWRLTT